MSYLPHKVPPTSQLFSSFRELPSPVRMADNPAYDGEKKTKIFKKTQKGHIFKFQEKKEAEEETPGFSALVKY